MSEIKGAVLNERALLHDSAPPLHSRKVVSNSAWVKVTEYVRTQSNAYGALEGHKHKMKKKFFSLQTPIKIVELKKG